jgi:hypothetical protein
MIGLKEPRAFSKERCVVTGQDPLNDAAIAKPAKKPEEVVSRRQLVIIPSSEDRTTQTVPT